MVAKIIQAILKAFRSRAEKASDQNGGITKRQVKSLFISAGHSDNEPGAVGNGFTESQIVTEFRDLVAKELEFRFIAFNKDGDKGQNLPLRQAVQIATTHDVAIEFHCNAFSSPSATGVETLCADPANKLSIELCATTARVLGIRNRGAKPEYSGQHSRLAFVSTGGGIVHELFFITNPSDMAAYQLHKQALAEEIAELLASYVCD